LWQTYRCGEIWRLQLAVLLYQLPGKQCRSVRNSVVLAANE
jgi:hypothetical protein